MATYWCLSTGSLPGMIATTLRAEVGGQFHEVERRVHHAALGARRDAVEARAREQPRRGRLGEAKRGLRLQRGQLRLEQRERIDRGRRGTATTAAGAPPPRPAALCDATVGSLIATRCAGVRASRSTVATAAASAKPTGRRAQRHRDHRQMPVALRAAGATRAGRRAATPRTCPRPARRRSAWWCHPACRQTSPRRSAIGRGARCPGTATTSTFHAIGLPSTVTREWSVNLRRWYGSTWKYVPLSPAGSKPRRFTSAAM